MQQSLMQILSVNILFFTQDTVFLVLIHRMELACFPQKEHIYGECSAFSG